MRGILINPDPQLETCIVSEVALRTKLDEDGQTEPDWQHVLDLINATMFDLIEVNQGPLAGHTAYVDGCGLLGVDNGFVHCPELYELPLAGKILLLATIDDPLRGPRSAGTDLSLEIARQRFTRVFVTRKYARAAHELHEQKVMAQYPDVIVARSSLVI